MIRKNNLKKILEGMGFDAVSPSSALLARLGMTVNRFNQIVDNRGKQEVTVIEADAINDWLINIKLDNIQLFDEFNKTKSAKL